MKFIQKHLLLLSLFACYTFSSCSQSVPTAKAAMSASKSEPTSGFVFDANLRPGGAAFYAMNSQTGEVSYMLDFGENAGTWSNYGTALRKPGGNPLLLKVVNNANGVAFYAMDGGTGQMYYMLDHGSNPGNWASFGGMIRQNALNVLQLDVLDRGEGNGNASIYAYDSYTHKTYYMNLVGENAGKWQSYGTPYQEEK